MKIRETIETYDRFAADYAARWQDRSVMARALARFGQLLPAQATVLDVGCGPGFDSAALRHRGLKVYGFDMSWGMLRTARDHYPGAYAQADMRCLPLAGGIDGIWCNAALLHLSRADALHTLGEFHRLLRDQGVLYLALKEGHGEEQRSEAYGADAPRYFTYWLDEQLDRSLHAAGFRLLQSWTDSPGEQRWLCRLLAKA